MQKAPVAGHHRSACSGVKALRNTSAAKAASRQAVLPFRSLDPFRALREPDRRRRDEKRPFPLRTKNRQRNPKQPLDRKSPIQVRIHSPPAKSHVRTCGESDSGHYRDMARGIRELARHFRFRGAHQELLDLAFTTSEG